MKNHNPFLRRLALMLAVFCLAVTAALPAGAVTQNINQKVTDDTTGVVQVKVVYTDDNQNVLDVVSGTGFLINNNTVITCDHVVTIDDELLQQASETFGKSVSEVKDRLGIQISVLRDVTIRATVRNQSAEMDYAILNLESQLYDRTYLKLRPSATVQQTETVYALGFPGEVEVFQDVNTYTSDDVTITNGQVNKTNRLNGVDYIQSSARITAGNSGGPLVDADGNVIGICQGATGTGFDINYFYAIAIDQLISTLDALGIEYTPWDATVPAPEPTDDQGTAPDKEGTEADKSALSALITDAQKMEVKDYDDASGTAFSQALDNAQNVLANASATQQQVDDALTRLSNAQAALVPKGSGFPIWLIVVILAVVIIVIVALILILTGSKKKKAAPEYAPVPAPAPIPAPAPAPRGVSVGGAPVGGGFSPAPNVPQNNFAPPMGGMGAGATTVLNAGSGETTVLNAGSGETTVLNAGSASYGTLTRAKSGERISINNTSFVIGKEMARVNYCISDNTSVSRTHVRLTSRGGVTYVTDLRTTNGTFVNGVKLNPNQEVALKNGDKLSLADEEFTFNAN